MSIVHVRRLAGDLPGTTLHVGDSSGHDVGPNDSGEVMSEGHVRTCPTLEMGSGQRVTAPTQIDRFGTASDDHQKN